CPNSLQSSICQRVSDSRLESDVTLRCETIRPFFWPAAGLLIIGVVLGVPLIFYDLISKSCAIIEEKFPIHDVSPEELAKKEEEIPDPYAKWRRQVAATNNVAKFLFQPFLPSVRYMRLFFLIQKLLSVFLSQFVIRIPGVHPTAIALGSGIGIHTIGFVGIAI